MKALVFRRAQAPKASLSCSRYQNRPFGNTFFINYLTATPQPTYLKIGPVGGDLATYQIPGDRVFHTFKISGLEENVPYICELFRGDGQLFGFDPGIPLGGTGQRHYREFTPTSTTFIDYGASDWQVLHSLDDQGLGINPSTADPDFDSTWMTMGLAGSSYDGPAFTSNQSAPFHIEGMVLLLGARSWQIREKIEPGLCIS